MTDDDIRTADLPPSSTDAARPASTVTLGELERETPGGRMADVGGHDPYAALRVPSFRRYAVGSILRSLGEQLQAAAIGWELVLRSPRPALALGLVGLAAAAPVILLVLPAGHLADRFNRKLLSVLTLVMAAACSVGLVTVSALHLHVGWIYAIVVVSGTAGAVGGPARSALLAQLIPRKLFSNGATWTSSGFQLAAVAGPAVGGWVIAIGAVHAFGRTLPTLPFAYGIDATCQLACAALLLSVVPRPIERRGEPASLQTLMAGIRFVRVNQIILATITLDLFAVLLGGATSLLPIYAKDVLHVEARGFGWMRAMPAIGAFAMALTLAHLPPMRRAGRNLLLAVAGFGLATIVFGLSKSLPLSLAMLFLTGALDNISVVVRSTLVQVLTPDDMRGRVGAVNNVFIGASNELGGFESGMTAQAFGPVRSVVGGGIGTLLVVVATAVAWPQVRRFGALHEAKPIDEPATPAFPVVAAPPEA